MLGTGSVARPLVGALPSGRLSAVNRNQLPGDKARIVRREEHHDGRQILGSIAVGLPERNGLVIHPKRRRFFTRVHPRHGLVVHRGRNGGQDGVDSDAILSPSARS